MNHYYLYRFLAEQGESFGARNAFLTGGGPGSLIMVAGAGQLASGPNADNAARFMEFMLSPGGPAVLRERDEGIPAGGRRGNAGRTAAVERNSRRPRSTSTWPTWTTCKGP